MIEIARKICDSSETGTPHELREKVRILVDRDYDDDDERSDCLSSIMLKTCSHDLHVDLLNCFEYDPLIIAIKTEIEKENSRTRTNLRRQEQGKIVEEACAAVAFIGAVIKEAKTNCHAVVSQGISIEQLSKSCSEINSLEWRQGVVVELTGGLCNLNVNVEPDYRMIDDHRIFNAVVLVAKKYGITLSKEYIRKAYNIEVMRRCLDDVSFVWMEELKAWAQQSGIGFLKCPCANNVPNIQANCRKAVV